MTVSGRTWSSRGPDMFRPAGYFKALSQVIQALPVAVIDEIVDVLLRAHAEGQTIFVYGNGGSAALASHSACDLGKGTISDDATRLRVVALTDNVPLITAWANDSAFDSIFAEQLRNLLRPGDVSFAISGSGNSPNVINALLYSRDSGAVNVGISGFSGGRMRDLCDICLTVPCDNMQLIEDLHVSVMHSVFTAVRHAIALSSRPRTMAAAD